MIDTYDVLSTLPHLRSIKEAANYSGISYAKLNGWAKKGQDIFYKMFILEYFRRVDLDRMKEIVKKYKLDENAGVSFVSENIFPEDVFISYDASAIPRKTDLIYFFIDAKKELLKEQIKIIEYFILTKYPLARRINQNGIKKLSAGQIKLLIAKI